MKFEKYLLPFRIAWKNIFSKKKRNANLIIIYGAALISLFYLYAFSNGLVYSIKNNMLESINGHIQIKKKSNKIGSDFINSSLETEVYRIIQNHKESFQVSGQIELKGIIKNEKGFRSIRILTIEDMNDSNSFFLKKDEIINYDPILFNNSGIIISENINKTLKTEKGLKVVLSTDQPFLEVGVRIAGFYKSKTKNKDKVYIFIKKKKLQKQLDKEKQINQLSVVINNENLAEDILKKLKNNLKQFKVTHWKEQYPFIDGFANLTNLLTVLFTNVVFLSLIFILVGAIIISLNEKTRDFYILFTIGFKKSNIFLIQLLETVILIIFAFIFSGAVIYFLFENFLKNGIDMMKFQNGLQSFYLDPILIPLPLISDFIFLIKWLSLIIILVTAIMTFYKVKKI